MKFLRAVVMLVAVIASLVLPGCSEPPRGVIVWHAYRGGEEAALKKVLARYESEAGVKVTALAVPYDAYAYKLEAAIPRGNGPDLFVNKHDDVGEFSRAGLIQPMDVPADHFLEGTVEPLRLEGHLWGLPLTFKSLALYYRRDKLSHPPVTTDELMK